MPSKSEFKNALNRMDRETRIAMLYLENLVEDKLREIRSTAYQPQKPVDLSVIESRINSLQGQMKDIKSQLDEALSFAAEHDDHEKFLKKTKKQLEEMIKESRKHFEELYDSGWYSEGKRRKLRDMGLIKKQTPP